MKLTLPLADLKSAVSRVTEVVRTKTTIPILTHIRLCTFRQADSTKLILTGTDMDRERSIEIAVDAEYDFAVCVPAGLLKRFLASAKGDDISIEADSQFATLSAGRRRAKLAILPSSDFPSINKMTGGAEFELPDVAALFEPVVHAMSTEETRYYLNGVFLHLRDGGDTLGAVATDGHRLALNSVPAPEILGGFPEPGVIVPRETVPILMKMADGKPLTLTVTEGKIRAEIDGETLVSRLIDGTFPDYQRVIPGGAENRRRVDRNDLADSARALDLIKSGLAVRAGENALLLETHDGDGNQFDDEVACDFVDDGPSDFGVNAGYLAMSLDAFPERIEMVEISQADAGSPIKITAETAPEIVQVVMPMQIRTAPHT